VLSDGAGGAQRIIRHGPVRNGMRCFPIIAAGNKTGARPEPAVRRKPMPGKSLCDERTGFLWDGRRYAAGLPGPVRSPDKPGLSVACGDCRKYIEAWQLLRLEQSETSGYRHSLY